jgi:hypothetical protein
MKTIQHPYIHLHSEYCIEGNANGVILYTKCVSSKTGKPYLGNERHFPCLTKALFHLIDNDLGQQRSLQAVIDRIDELKKCLLNSIYELSGDDQVLKGIQLFSPRLKCLKCEDFRKP